MAFTGFAIPASEFGTKNFAAESVLASYFTNKILWNEIRIKGGAYGAQAIAMGKERCIVFASHLDPEANKSIETYKRILELECNNFIYQDEIINNIVGVISKEIKPLSLRDELLQETRYKIMSINEGLRTQHRRHVKTVNKIDLNNTANRLFSNLNKATFSIIESSKNR